MKEGFWKLKWTQSMSIPRLYSCRSSFIENLYGDLLPFRSWIYKTLLPSKINPDALTYPFHFNPSYFLTSLFPLLSRFPSSIALHKYLPYTSPTLQTTTCHASQIDFAFYELINKIFNFNPKIDEVFNEESKVWKQLITEVAHSP